MKRVGGRICATGKLGNNRNPDSNSGDPSGYTSHQATFFSNCIVLLFSNGSSDRSFLPYCDVHLSENGYPKKKKKIG